MNRYANLTILLTGIALFHSACSVPETAPSVPGGIEIEGVVIRNQLAFAVTDAGILALSTGNFVSCGNITARTACSTGFPNRNYSSGKLVVRWRERGVDQSTDEFELQIEGDIDAHRPAWIEVVIFSPGEAGARLVQ
jgi:hypothetical protein